MNRYRVNPGTQVNLKGWDPADSSAFSGDKDASKKVMRDLVDELADLQEVLFAEQKHKVLIVLQAMDTGGKDGTIRNVFSGVNPQGVQVANFKVPSKEEISHDFLWRIHRHTPRVGQIIVFNRSHYEDVLVVRVHKLVAREIWSRRYDHINDFERMLSDEGTTILKFFLHISLEEQKERLQARLDEPDKRWKFNRGDLDERARWPEYIRAYEDMLSRTSTSWAPWFVVPADRKWYRNLVVASNIIHALQNLKMRFPQPDGDLGDVVIE